MYYLLLFIHNLQRKPIKLVLQYRQNAKRLKKGGKIEEAAEWEEKARKLDEEQQEIWRNRIATSIVTSKWGGSGAQIDQMTKSHQTELNNLYKTQNMKRDVLYATHKTLRRNFENTLKAEITRLELLYYLRLF